jgi:hypothetical protein
VKQLAFADGLSLPVDVVTQKTAFMGRTGSGKTYAATKLAELLIRAGAQVVAIDPVGVWWGLRLEADGKTPSDLKLPIFGGLHGDIPLEPTGGKLMADLIVDRALSCVLDVSQFESDADKARFVRDFADRFFYRKKAAPSAVHLFLEEAQEFVPQNPTGDDAKMLHVLNRLIKLGRNFGIGVSLVSQRPQEVNKKALNQTELLLAFQMTGPQERKAIGAWVNEKGSDEDVADILPGLKVGQPHVWSPQWLGVSKTVKVNEKLTYNASSTPTFGAKAVESKPLGDIDLSQLQERMAATIEKAKATDPRHLQQEVARLKREIDKRVPATMAIKVDHDRDRQLVERAVAKAVSAERRRLAPALAKLQRAVSTLTALDLPAAVGAIAQALNEAPVQSSEPRADLAESLDHALTRVVERRPSLPPARVRETVPSDGLSGAQQKILDAVATLNELGVEQPTLVQVALFVGVSHTTGSYQQNVRNLAEGGYLGRGNGAGRAHRCRPEDRARRRRPRPDWVLETETAGRAVQAARADPRPRADLSEQLAEKAGVSHTTGSYQQNLRDMRTYGIIEIESGQINVSELLSPHAYA